MRTTEPSLISTSWSSVPQQSPLLTSNIISKNSNNNILFNAVDIESVQSGHVRRHGPYRSASYLISSVMACSQNTFNPITYACSTLIVPCQLTCLLTKITRGPTDEKKPLCTQTFSKSAEQENKTSYFVHISHYGIQYFFRKRTKKYGFEPYCDVHCPRVVVNQSHMNIILGHIHYLRAQCLQYNCTLYCITSIT